MEGNVIYMYSFNLNSVIGSGIGLLSVLLLGMCLYFILSFFQYLNEGDKRLVKQSKFFAVITLLLALAIPSIYQLFF